MKKSVLLIVALILVTVTAMAADVAQPTAGGMMVANFEGFEGSRGVGGDSPIFDKVVWASYDDTGAGKMSKMLGEVTNDAANGSKAIKVTWTLDGWCGMIFGGQDYASNPAWNWSNYKAISFYIKSADGKKVNMILRLADANDERFGGPLVKVTPDWQQVVIPFDKFKARSDWQPDTSKRDTFLDFPIREMEFAPQSPKGSVIIDMIEAIP